MSNLSISYSHRFYDQILDCEFAVSTNICPSLSTTLNPMNRPSEKIKSRILCLPLFSDWAASECNWDKHVIDWIHGDGRSRLSCRAVSVGIGFIDTSGDYTNPKASMSGNADRHSLLNIVLSDLLDALYLDSSTLLV